MRLMAIEFYSVDEMRNFTESEVLNYSCALMNRKLELAEKASDYTIFVNQDEDDRKKDLAEAERINEQLELLNDARSIRG